MHSNVVLQRTDTRRLSPQTTSSSGYHSDLSSTNESPQSIHENRSTINKQSNYVQINKTINNNNNNNNNKSLKTKNISRISSFIRKQYERAKSKLILKRHYHQSSPIKTCSKATSTTPLSYLSENNNIKLRQSSPIYQQSSFIEPSKIHSIHVYPLYDNQIRISSENYASIHDCYSHQPSRRLLSYSKRNINNQQNSYSYHRLTTVINHENLTKNYLSTNDNIFCQQNYLIKPSLCQNYYPYKYLNKNYDFNRSLYEPISDFISTKNSAFKPIKFYRRPSLHSTSEQISPSDDPCDLEVAQYFHPNPQWSNPNYFDIYTNEVSTKLPRKTYTETLC
ncbi:unnamed protein product [Rotaria sp. Silwood1]|nr:unnamed protein product [Rotaria sp. Silwood1]CAF1468944.1 unnamed protein product [Rotaria sp. Silwood1]CAF1471337.1 unnamed protein product [Rotaria sp. Silwood1]CAF3592956.1 unnamed protein product [Rotaria sp. Silwood1]CAF3630012.1 unnamed protein product [Rotaria sp. Silwood1]